MLTPALLLLISLAGLVLGLTQEPWSDIVIPAGAGAVASLYILLRSIDPWYRAGKPVIIDGSNVMFWAGVEPDIKIVRNLVKVLSRRGLQPGVIFDANVGYRIAGIYMDDAVMARALKLPVDQVLVVPKGTPADQYILDAARGMHARVVSNDRYRNWADRYPEVKEANFLVQGGIKNGKPWIAWGRRRSGA